MMQITFPVQWDSLLIAQLRKKIETGIRSQIEKGNLNVTGEACVADLNLGTVAPTVVVTKLKEISASRFALDVHVSYKGDAGLRLSKLKIDLDACPSIEPFDESSLFSVGFALKEIHIEGTMSVEITQRLALNPSYKRERPLLPSNLHRRSVSLPTVSKQTQVKDTVSVKSGASSRSWLSSTKFKRQPLCSSIVPTTVNRPVSIQSQHPNPSHVSSSTTPMSDVRAFTWYDLLQKRAIATHRVMRIQPYDNPIKDFTISTGGLVGDAQLRPAVKKLLEPVIEEWKSCGIDLVLQS